ncbi:hypothetical protein B0T20DRAFT_254762 [Sordaria brevicollis]|uniref:Uncharacterized protein n=1 Tax=Sordaria brevicollis TaxID=83679 RepID=A0AAE0PCC8_SORBR|nr:hypothetical protein B0T20DRAFT_254762 [Sordaria brevicollis]
MAVIMSLVPTNTVALAFSAVLMSTASPAAITSAAVLRRQDDGDDFPITTRQCGYASDEKIDLKAIVPPTNMVCALDPLNRLFGFCPRQNSIKSEQDIVDYCKWNAWCIDSHECSNGCGIEEARAKGKFGTTKCNISSRPFCQMTRLGNIDTDEELAYWSVGCGSGHYSIHNYVLEPIGGAHSLPTSIPAITTTVSTTVAVTTLVPTTSSSKLPFVNSTDDNITAPRTQAPVATSAPTSSPSSRPSSSPPPPSPSTATTTSSSSKPSSSTLSSVLLSTKSPASETHAEPRTSSTPTFISSANTPSKEDQEREEEDKEAKKKDNPQPAILGSVIGALAVIYLLLFTWWYRGPRRRKRAREAKEAAEAALRERGFWPPPGAPDSRGPGPNNNNLNTAGLGGDNTVGSWAAMKPMMNVNVGPAQEIEIHELGFGRMTNPLTPRLPEMPNTPGAPKTFQTRTNGNETEHQHGLSPLGTPIPSSRWGGHSSISATTSASSNNPRFRSAFESGIFGFGNGNGIEKPAYNAKMVPQLNATAEETVAELDGRSAYRGMPTFEERNMERMGQFDDIAGLDLAHPQPVPVPWEMESPQGGESGAGTGTGTPVARTTLVPPTEWYLGQKAEEDGARETIHVGWRPYGGKQG